MAQSPSHRFGQIIGDALEDGARSLLAEFARRNNLFLDKNGRRPCRSGLKCSWVDLNGNSHDLDFVLERDESPTRLGAPVAFIEIAWRRYTKHSRNKAQEIQGAIEPLAETYRQHAPFKGAILAGEFTQGALDQLRSLGFHVLHFPLETILGVFRRAGVDAFYDESTPDAEFERKINAYEKLKQPRRDRLAADLIEANRDATDAFVESLTRTIRRRIERVVVLVLHGAPREVESVEAAIRFLDQEPNVDVRLPIARFEIEIRFNNGNVIRGSFQDRSSAVEFLRQY